MVFRSLTLIGSQVERIFTEDWYREQILQDLPVPLKWALDLLPCHEFTHLFGQFPKFLKVDMAIWKAVSTALIEEINIFD